MYGTFLHLQKMYKKKTLSNRNVPSDRSDSMFSSDCSSPSGHTVDIDFYIWWCLTIVIRQWDWLVEKKKTNSIANDIVKIINTQYMG